MALKKLQKSTKRKKFNPRSPISIENSYDRWLRQMLADLKASTIKHLPEIRKNFKQQKENIKTDGIADIYAILSFMQSDFLKVYSSKRIKSEAEKQFNNTSEFNRQEQARSLNAATDSTLTQKKIASDVILSTTSKAIMSQKQVFVRQNVALIKSISEKYFADIEQDISRITAETGTSKALSAALQKRYNTSKSKANLIARDQISKLNGNLSKQRQQDLGLNLYEWSTAGDSRVRQAHKNIDGKICKWSDNSVYADTIEDANNGKWKKRSSINAVELAPAQDFQCRCVALPIIE